MKNAKFKLYDEVELITDKYITEELYPGAKGTILEIYAGNFYEIEFYEPINGNTIALHSFSESDIALRKTHPIIEIYQDDTSAWRWRLLSQSRVSMASSDCSYNSKQQARASIETLIKVIKDETIEYTVV